MKIQGPITVEIKVSVTNGELSGVATYEFGKGKYPTEQEIRDAVVRLEHEGLPKGFRPMTKREYWDSICPPFTGEDDNGEVFEERFAMPSGEEYDA